MRCIACKDTGFVPGAYHPQHNPTGLRDCPLCSASPRPRARRATALTGVYAPATGVRS
jgi:hypothetical protein